MKEKIVWTALITPMHENGDIHFDDLKKMALRQENAGNGILALGSTGEGLALEEDEKRKIVDYLADLNLSVPLMIGVGGFQLTKQVGWIKECNSKNIQAFLLVTPLYAKPSDKGQVEWFSRLLDVSEKPCMLYNIPSRTGCRLTPEVLKAIEDHPNLWAVKESGGSIQQYQKLREKCAGVPLYCGDDGLLAFYSPAGCSGLVSVAANVWPDETQLYAKKCLKGDTESLFPVWTNAVEALFCAPNPVPVKCFLNHKKMIETNVLRAPLTAAEMNSLTPMNKADDGILNWYKSNKE